MDVMAVQMQAADYGGPEQLRAVDVEVPAPGPGEVTIDVRAAGVNPTDYKSLGGYRGKDPAALPLRAGSEVAGVLSAVGPGTEIATGGGAVGDAVLAFRVSGGYSERLTVPARDVFAKPDALDFPAAANLLLVGATALDMLRVVPVAAGDTVVVHGGSSSVGALLLQLLRPLDVRVVGTASEPRFEAVTRFGGEPVRYGDGLEQRLRDAAPGGYAAAFDCVGTDEAVDVSLALVPAERLVTIAAFERAQREGFQVVGGTMPASIAFRDGVRGDLVDRAGRGELVVPVARTFPLRDAAAALQLLAEQHPGGKLALVP